TDPAYRVWLNRLFRFLLQQDNKTAHLVLTKFDLLVGPNDDPDTQLKKVVAKLDDYQPFRQFVEFPRPGKIRLIPVAALGTKGFVYREDGADKIRTEYDLDPSDAEYPLACTLPDVLITELEQLRAAAPGFKARPGGDAPRWEQYR